MHLKMALVSLYLESQLQPPSHPWKMGVTLPFWLDGPDADFQPPGPPYYVSLVFYSQHWIFFKTYICAQYSRSACPLSKKYPKICVT